MTCQIPHRGRGRLEPRLAPLAVRAGAECALRGPHRGRGAGAYRGDHQGRAGAAATAGQRQGGRHTEAQETSRAQESIREFE